ncbi:DUF3570 domain-containing protein [Endothiovibrio diazotrophicus]
MSKSLSALMAAAAALHVVTPAGAGEATDHTEMAFKYLDYIDYQKDQDRIHVRAPMAWLRAPLDERTEVTGTLVMDSVSGASPWYLSTLSGASGKGISEWRRALDLKVTRYFDRLTVGFSAGVSSENDYLSQSLGLDLRYDSDDRNTTYAVGIGHAGDRIGSTNNAWLSETRSTRDLFAGVTRVIDPLSIVQSNLSYSDGSGYYDDPYKPLDHRPDNRRKLAWLTRYRRFIPDWDAALSADYRYYRDSWGVRAHSIELALQQPLKDGWSLRPSVRYHTQDAADFFQASFPPATFGSIYSADQRLASFGAVTLGLKVSKEVNDQLTLDFGVERYRQRASLHWGSDGSPNLEPFDARILFAGLNYRF